MTVPPEAITAATRALHEMTLRVPCPEDREIALAVLDAAGPLIAAAERERCVNLAEEHNAVADPCYDEQPFADLLRGDQP